MNLHRNSSGLLKQLMYLECEEPSKSKSMKKLMLVEENENIDELGVDDHRPGKIYMQQ